MGTPGRYVFLCEYAKHEWRARNHALHALVRNYGYVSAMQSMSFAEIRNAFLETAWFFE